jgi:hypothetical protein
MKFSDLPQAVQSKIHEELLASATALGGKNFLLQLIEDIKKEPEVPLILKERHFSFSKGFVQWNKSLYKDTVALLFDFMVKEEADEDFIARLKPKDQKRYKNLFKTLSPVILTIKPKNIKDGEGFSFAIVERSASKESEVRLLFKALFFYHISFAKEALSYEKS